mgnify:CR=1 FL=1
MTDTTEEAAPDVTSDGPAETTNLMTEALEAEETQESPEQTETTDATDGESQGEQASAPESYEFTAPEGVEINPDSAAIAALSEHAKSLNLSQEQAQEAFQKLDAAVRADAQQQHKQLEASWIDETRNDPVLGGENLRASMVKADQALATIPGGADLRPLLTETGLINNKAVIAYLVGTRDAISADQFIAGKSTEDKPELTPAQFFGEPVK